MHFPLLYTNIFLRFKYDFENGSAFSCFFLSSVTVMTGYGRMFGVRYRVKEETINVRHCFPTELRVRPASFEMRAGGFPPVVKRPEHEDNSSPPCSTKIQNPMNHYLCCPMCFHSECWAQHRHPDNITAVKMGKCRLSAVSSVPMNCSYQTRVQWSVKSNKFDVILTVHLR